MKRLPMRKIHDVLRLSAEGLSTRRISASLSIGRTTLRGYLDRAHIAGVSWPLAKTLTDAELEKLLYPRTAQAVSQRATVPNWPDLHRERWSRKFGPVVKVDRLTKVTIRNEETKEPFAGVQSQSCA